MPDLLWPNVERAVVAWLGARTGLPTYTETDTAPSLPVERLMVARVGGAGRGIEKDVDVEVEVYAERMSAQGSYSKVTEASLTYVAIDDKGKPRPIEKPVA